MLNIALIPLQSLHRLDLLLFKYVRIKAINFSARSSRRRTATERMFRRLMSFLCNILTGGFKLSYFKKKKKKCIYNLYSISTYPFKIPVSRVDCAVKPYTRDTISCYIESAKNHK